MIMMPDLIYGISVASAQEREPVQLFPVDLKLKNAHVNDGFGKLKCEDLTFAVTIWISDKDKRASLTNNRTVVSL